MAIEQARREFYFINKCTRVEDVKLNAFDVIIQYFLPLFRDPALGNIRECNINCHSRLNAQKERDFWQVLWGQQEAQLIVMATST